MPYSILRLAAVLARTGLSRSTIYLRISEGHFPKPVSLGGRAVGWPDYEVHAINQARLQGRSNKDIRTLVNHLMEARSNPSAQEAAVGIEPEVPNGSE